MEYIESNVVELKEKVTNNLGKEIVSFLNSDGGVIYIGVKDDGTVVGVNDVDKACRTISDIITTQIEPNPQDLIKTELIFENSMTIISITILKGKDPLYCQKKYGYSSLGCTERIGTTCREMTQDQINNRYQKKFFHSDLLINSQSNYYDIKFSILKIYYNENGFHLDDENFENNLSLRNSKGEYNMMAELLSDRNNIPLIFAKFRGSDKTSFSQRSDYGNRCILFAYQQLMGRINSENVRKCDTSVRPRIDTDLFDYECVNEAIVNAIVHNDWSISEPSVFMFNDRIEILSHGGLPHNQTKENFFKGISVPRNKELMRIFLNMEFVEHTGHGIPSILKKYGKEAFEIDNNYIKVIIPFDKEVLKETSMGLNITSELTDVENEVVNNIIENPKSTAKNIASALNMTERTIERTFNSLKNKGIIARFGSNKSGRWRVIN